MSDQVGIEACRSKHREVAVHHSRVIENVGFRIHTVSKIASTSIELYNTQVIGFLLYSNCCHCMA